MIEFVRKPQTWTGIQVDENTTAADFRSLYEAAEPGGTATIDATPVGDRLIVTTTAEPSWVGSFNKGDLVYYNAPIFLKLEPAEDYAPYEDVYVTPIS